ncbi:hypothetical protein SAMD00079811_32010 [Scytonema sp. HK-05]|nr:hypothetical protein SAMD00079811_32010 [Scytonema sp. HK-05]
MVGASSFIGQCHVRYTRRYSSLKTMMVLPVLRRFGTRPLLPYTRVYPGSRPPPAGSEFLFRTSLCGLSFTGERNHTNQ